MEALLYVTFPEEAPILITILNQCGLSSRIVQRLDALSTTVVKQPTELVLLALGGETDKVLPHIRRLRGHVVPPILVITDPLPESALVDIMEAGADWVITRPYGNRLLGAQIRSLLKRGAGLPFHILQPLTQSGLRLDPSLRTVSVFGGDPIRLTQLEFRLLYTLFMHPGQIIPTDSLIEFVWGYSGDGSRTLVRGLIKRVRDKIEPDSSAPVFILTEPGIGYRLTKHAPPTLMKTKVGESSSS